MCGGWTTLSTVLIMFVNKCALSVGSRPCESQALPPCIIHMCVTCVLYVWWMGELGTTLNVFHQSIKKCIGIMCCAHITQVNIVRAKHGVTLWFQHVDIFASIVTSIQYLYIKGKAWMRVCTLFCSVIVFAKGWRCIQVGLDGNLRSVCAERR